MKITTARLLPLYLVIFLASLGYSMMITIFTPMLFYDTNGSLSERMIWLGCLLALYPLGQFCGTPLITHLSKKWGRKGIYLLSLALTAMGYAWIGISLESSHLEFLALSVFVTGFSESNFTMADHTIIEVALEHQQPRWIRYIEASTNCAFLIGPIIGGLLSRSGLSLPFWMISFLLFATICWLVYNLPIIGSPKTPPLLWKTLKERQLGPFFVNFLIYFAIFGFFRAYPMDLVDRFNLDVVSLSLYIVWVAIPLVAATFFLTEYLLKHFSPKRIVALGAFIIGFFMMLLPFTDDSNLLLLTDLGLVSVGIGFCLPVCPILAALTAPRNQREQMFETDASLVLGTEAFSSLIGGGLAAFFIELPLFAFSASAFLAAAFLSSSIVKHGPSGL